MAESIIEERQPWQTHEQRIIQQLEVFKCRPPRYNHRAIAYLEKVLQIFQKDKLDLKQKAIQVREWNMKTRICIENAQNKDNNEMKHVNKDSDSDYISNYDHIYYSRYNDIYANTVKKKRKREWDSEWNIETNNRGHKDRKLTQEKVAGSQYVDSQRPLFECEADTEKAEAAERDKLDADTRKKLTLLLGGTSRTSLQKESAEERYCLQLRQNRGHRSRKEIARRLASLDRLRKVEDEHENYYIGHFSHLFDEGVIDINFYQSKMLKVTHDYSIEMQDFEGPYHQTEVIDRYSASLERRKECLGDSRYQPRKDFVAKLRQDIVMLEDSFKQSLCEFCTQKQQNKQRKHVDSEDYRKPFVELYNNCRCGESDRIREIKKLVAPLNGSELPYGPISVL